MHRMAQVSAGDAAPRFDLLDDGGKRVTLDELRQGRLVLYFFPKADTSG
jgi:thioredoxin-dependent peroxiredoxin